MPLQNRFIFGSTMQQYLILLILHFKMFQTMKVKAAYERFLQEIPADIKDSLVSKYKLLETSAVRDLSKELFESTLFDFMGMKGGNNAETSLKCRIKEHNFLIPPNSR